MPAIIVGKNRWDASSGGAFMGWGGPRLTLKN